MIELKNVSHTYAGLDNQKVKAIDNVSFSISEGEMVGLIGATGSGKSTIMQIISALLTPSSGQVMVDGLALTSKNFKHPQILGRVGFVFQYSEQQLFEETVRRDIAFGPTNMGLSASEIEDCVSEACEWAGVSPELLDCSPFHLSGGQKRRVALAGVLALKPKILLLDEPTAGMDYSGRCHIIDTILSLNRHIGTTIIFVGHRMGEIAQIANRILVMDSGQLVLDGDLPTVFKDEKLLNRMSLELPPITAIVRELRRRGAEISGDTFTIADAANEIKRRLCSHK